MNESDFQSNFDWHEIANTPIEKIKDKVKEVQAVFRDKVFKCFSLEEYVKGEDTCSCVSFEESPEFANDNVFLKKWFDTVANLGEGEWLLLNEIGNRRLAFKQHNLDYFKKIGIQVDKSIRDLREIGLISQSENPKYCDKLSEFAMKGLEYYHWQEKLIEVYTQTIFFYASNKRKLAHFKEVVQSGIVPAVKILVGNNDICKECFAFRNAKDYDISTIDTIPSLPLHWGCTCLYNSVFKEHSG